MTARDEFRQALAVVLEVEASQLTLDSRFETFAAWDSLAVVSIVALVNQYFGKTISAEAVQAAATPRAVLQRIES
jgi:acyl carrier protein